MKPAGASPLARRPMPKAIINTMIKNDFPSKNCQNHFRSVPYPSMRAVCR